MDQEFHEFQIRWCDVDANVHLRHSSYADYCAQTRVQFLEEVGLSFNELNKLRLGPILFREELIYKREVPLNDKIKVSCQLVKCRADGSRWSMQHEIFKGDGQKAAVINVDGAWLDLDKRKLAALPVGVVEKFFLLPKAKDFHIF